MSQPNEENTSQHTPKKKRSTWDDSYEVRDVVIASEDVRPTGEKIPVKKDVISVEDDYSNYKFLKPKKSRHHHHSSSSDGKKHHHRKHRKKKMKTWKKVVLIVVSVILTIAILISAVTVFLVYKGRRELFDVDLQVVVPEEISADVQDDGDSIIYEGSRYRYNHDVTTLLFLGVDKQDLEGLNEMGTGGQSDVIVAIAIDVKYHKMTMIALPRDTVTEVALYTTSDGKYDYYGIENMQICKAYAYGDGKRRSCENTLSSVRRIFFNVPIQTYYALDLRGISAMNDAVGGISVTAPETIGDFKEGQTYFLHGKQAELFVRDRTHTEVDASLKRLERQKVYARSFLATMQSSLKKNPTSAIKLFNQSSPYSCTNLNAAKVSYLAKEFMFGGGMSTDIVTVPGSQGLDADGETPVYTIDQKAFFEQFLSVYYIKD